MLEWSSLRFVDHAPVSVWIVTSVFAGLVWIVLESRDWLDFKSRHYFRVSLISLVFLWAAGVIFAFAKFGVTSEPKIAFTPGPIFFPPIQGVERAPPGIISWEDAMKFEQAFMTLPKPCFVKLPPTREALEPRNIFSAILRINKTCTVVDDAKDSGARGLPREDVDATPPPKFNGMILRWHPDFAPGNTLFENLSYFIIHEGHAMPENSPHDLVILQIGYAPWKR